MAANATGLAVAAATVLGLSPALTAQGNSTRKVRPRPGEVAARAGTAVRWLDDVDAALEVARRSDRKVFWYVPTVAGSPMDRKVEIDRYMMAGPFSHPEVIAQLARDFVAVRAIARGEWARRFDLLPGRFVEPGYLVLGPRGELLKKRFGLATLHPRWFCVQLARAAGTKVVTRSLPGPLAAAWAALARGEPEAACAVLAAEPPGKPAVAAEWEFLRGAAEFRAGRTGAARTRWRRLARRLPEQPWAWKAAAEAEGHGPFARGFEVYTGLPAAALESAEATTRAPFGVYHEGELRARSLAFLAGMQEPDGTYRDSRYDFGGTDGLPNVHLAITALVGMALLEELADEGCPGPRARLEVVLRKIREAVLDEGLVNTSDQDEVVWPRIYAVRFLSRWMELRGDEGLREPLQQAVKALEKLQAGGGAWFHEYSNPFVTASALLALDAARARGAGVDPGIVARGVQALRRCRATSGAFSYGMARGRVTTPVAAAAARMPLCELALFRAGRSDAERLAAAVREAFVHHDRLESVRRYDDHAGPLGYGGFFFWYDMRARTEAILALPPGEDRTAALRRQRRLVRSIAEVDGCFVDSHELGRVYGTAMALWCLARLRAALSG